MITGLLASPDYRMAICGQPALIIPTLVFFTGSIGVLLAACLPGSAEVRRPRVVCMGDSLTDCGGIGGRYPDFLALALPECEVFNRGVGGDSLSRGRTRFSNDVLELQPDIVILELGANDFWARRPIREMQADLEAMILASQAEGCSVILAGLFGDQVDREGHIVPKRHQPGAPADLGPQVLEMERSLARQYGCLHVENIQADLNEPQDWGDERHPGPAGNRKVAARLLPAVQALLAARRGAP